MCELGARIQSAVSVAIWNNHSNLEIAFHIVAKMWFSQLKNLFDAAVLSWIGHIKIAQLGVLLSLEDSSMGKGVEEARGKSPPCL